jgi:hypothetical protein
VTILKDELVQVGQADFPEQIERLVRDKGLSYLDAVVHWCDTRDPPIEYLVGAEMVKKNAVLKAKVQIEAENLNFLPKSARLPI